jgi:hypothetical protein
MGRVASLRTVNRCFELRVVKWVARRTITPVAGLVHLQQLGVADVVEPKMVESVRLDTSFEPTFLLSTAILVEL